MRQRNHKQKLLHVHKKTQKKKKKKKKKKKSRKMLGRLSTITSLLLLVAAPRPAEPATDTTPPEPLNLPGTDPDSCPLAPEVSVDYAHIVSSAHRMRMGKPNAAAGAAAAGAAAGRSTQQQPNRAQLLAAAACFRRACDLRPTVAECQLQLGETLDAAGDRRGAEVALRRAVDLAPPELPEAHFKLGNILREARGDDRSAVVHYERALKLRPGYSVVYNNLGLALRALGRDAEAIAAYERGLAVDPQFAELYVNLGYMMSLRGSDEAARRHYEAALRLRPGWAEVEYNLGTVYERADGDAGKAAAAYRRALAAKPDFHNALHNLGSLLYRAGQLQESVALLRRAVALSPATMTYANSLSNALRASRSPRDVEESVAVLRAALERAPKDVDTMINLANALIPLERYKEARRLLRRALKIQPDSAAAHSNLGDALRNADRYLEAVPHYRSAVRLAPTFDAPFCNLAYALQYVSDWRTRDEDNRRLASILDRAAKSPVSATTHVCVHPFMALAYPLPLAQVGAAAKVYAERAERIAAETGRRPFRHDRRSTTRHGRRAASMSNDASNAAAAAASDNRAPAPHDDSAPAAPLPVPPPNVDRLGKPRRTTAREARMAEADDQRELRAAAEARLGRPAETEQEKRRRLQARDRRAQEEARARAARDAAARSTARAGGRVRVGFVGFEFGNFPVGKDMRSVFGLIDRTRFEVLAYALNPDDGSPWRRWIRADVDVFRDLSATPSARAADLIHADAVDILISMTGYTKGERSDILALRPAPVQVFFKGFAGTSGARFIDYILTDASSTPAHLAPHYSERLAVMNNSFFVSDYSAYHAETIVDPGDGFVARRADYGLPATGFVYACFNQLYKIDPRIFDVWMAVLRRVEGAVLWLMEFPAEGIPAIRREASARGIDPSRLVFLKKYPDVQHLRIKALADLFLDTPLYNAHGTAADALWAGVPVLTVDGEHKMAGRVAMGLVRAIGTPELVAPDLAAYERIAVELALNSTAHSALVDRVRQNRVSSTLFDTADWTRRAEAMFLAMHEISHADPPASRPGGKWHLVQ
jgi:protein O-GlcNAc transferase